jgi:hypothetical protein
MTLAVVAALAAGVADLADMGEAVGGLMQKGAEHVDRAALEAFATDQHLGPVGELVGAGELPAGGGEVTEIQPPAPGVAAGGDHDHDLGDVGVVAADAGPGVFQGGDQAAGGTVDRRRGGHGLLALSPAAVANCPALTGALSALRSA